MAVNIGPLFMLFPVRLSRDELDKFGQRLSQFADFFAARLGSCRRAAAAAGAFGGGFH